MPPGRGLKQIKDTELQIYMDELQGCGHEMIRAETECCRLSVVSPELRILRIAYLVTI
jgi:hypothetical protein